MFELCWCIQLFKNSWTWLERVGSYSWEAPRPLLFRQAPEQVFSWERGEGLQAFVLCWLVCFDSSLGASSCLVPVVPSTGNLRQKAWLSASNVLIRNSPSSVPLEGTFEMPFQRNFWLGNTLAFCTTLPIISIRQTLGDRKVCLFLIKSSNWS